jgi:hypothetical protein
MEAQTHFLSKFKCNFYQVHRPKIWATSVIFKTLSKANDRPVGENLPNQVTLAGSSLCFLPRNFSPNVPSIIL